MNPEELSIQQLLIVAAYRLYEKGRDPFTESELTVEAWTLNPQRLGLAGFEKEHPDNNKVRAGLAVRKSSKNTRNAVERGLLIKEGTLLYKLSVQGRLVARAITNGNHAKYGNSLTMVWKKDLHAFNMARGSCTFRDWRQFGQKGRFDWAQAREFWNFTAASEVEPRLLRVASVIEKKKEMDVGNGEIVNEDLVNAVIECHIFLRDNFGGGYRNGTQEKTGVGGQIPTPGNQAGEEVQSRPLET